MAEALRIGIAGLGTVGASVARVIATKAGELTRQWYEQGKAQVRWGRRSGDRMGGEPSAPPPPKSDPT